MTQNEFLEDMIDHGEVIVEAKELRKLLQKVNKQENGINFLKEKLENVELFLNIWKKNYYNLLEEKRLKISLKV